MIAPWIFAGPDRDKAIAAVGVGHRPSAAGEIRVRRRVVVVTLVRITARGIGLPDLHQRIGDRLAVGVEDAPADDDAFADRVRGVLLGQVEIVGADQVAAEQRAGDLGQRRRQHHQWLRR
jgi:hypothetical protein